MTPDCACASKKQEVSHRQIGDRLPADGTDIFGPGHTWWGVYQYTLAFTRRTWPGVRNEDIEDAVSAGVARTMEMWVRWKGSVVKDDPNLTYAGAKRHACMATHKLLKVEVKRQRGEDIRFPALPSDTKDTAAASAVIEELAADEREWATWARGFLAGESERDSADALGVSQQAVNRRRKRGLTRSRALFLKHGLIGGNE